MESISFTPLPVPAAAKRAPQHAAHDPRVCKTATNKRMYRTEEAFAEYEDMGRGQDKKNGRLHYTVPGGSFRLNDSCNSWLVVR